MAFSDLTAEDRAQALRKAAATRRERAELLNGLKTGDLSLREFLGRNDPVVARTRVLNLLRALPGVGKVGATRTMTELDTTETRRVQGLGTNQRDKLLARFAPGD